MTAVLLDEATFIPAPLLDCAGAIQPARPAASRRRVAAIVQAIVQAIVVAGAFAVTALAVLPALLGYSGQVVLSGSMEPRLHVGDVSYLKAAPVSSLHVGQIVTFPVANDGHPVEVTHRIIAVTGSGPSAVLTTKGDANPTADAFTTRASRVKGVYAFTVPKLGKALKVMHDRTTYFTVAGLIFLLVLLHEGRVLLGEYRCWKAKRTN